MGVFEGAGREVANRVPGAQGFIGISYGSMHAIAAHPITLPSGCIQNRP